MWYEIFKFEIKYRIQRPETYLFFIFLLTISIFGVDFILEGVELGLIKKNAPIVVGKTMGVITGIFMILASMVMGMPIIRDDQYQITPLLYTTPTKKIELLSGRFLGSFLILVFIFCGLPFGMMLGELLPWHLEAEMLPFRLTTYIASFMSVVLPTLFFGASLFFVTGALSRKLLVVYTQGILLFVVFLLTKAITNDYLQATLDPFSLTTITQLTKDWSVEEKNSLLLPFSGVLMVNKICWISLGLLAMFIGYFRFNFSATREQVKRSKSKVTFESINKGLEIGLPQESPQYGWQSQVIQYCTMSIFHAKALLKETSFWAIVICGIIIIIANSISLGTVYGVDSYPTTYFIVEELQELSSYFFIIIMLFYSGELYWKERGAGLNFMTDATPISSFISLSSKMTGLIGVYIVLILSLILSGITFQIIKGYYYLDLPVYFSGFFLEILSFLIIHTFAAFFIQSIVNNKFLGIIINLIFFIATVALGPLGFNHVLFNYGGGGLNAYSEMNGHGHFMNPYLWSQAYWLLFGILVLIAASLVAGRGVDTQLIHRLKAIRTQVTGKIATASGIISILFLLTGSYLYYQTNVLNKVWTEEEKQSYRASYEKTLKQFQYKLQPKIVAANLQIELYPDERAYDLMGEYILKNEGKYSVNEIHIQKLIEADISLDSVRFSVPITLDNQYQEFEYAIYQLTQPLAPGDSISMYFKQVLKPKGFGRGASSVLHNGTFIHNDEFPTLGYNKKYELQEAHERKLYDLSPRPIKAAIDDAEELRVAIAGNDSDGIRVNMVIGTNADQTGITSGDLVRQWTTGNRNYFEYRTDKPIINFYAILSGRYELLTDQWKPSKANQAPVNLEIYYHPRHTYNLDRMVAGMKASLDYYSTNFSSYQYAQLRIVEFPRYQDFAQSLPNTIPFSESIGFLLDIDDSTEVDMTFFVTAHEVAHQWWGMQIETANVKGRNFVLETLSQYAALMVFKRQFSQTKVDRLLDFQKQLYEDGKSKSKVEEAPLYLVENEKHIYYNKGAMVMYQLQESIGEENINRALRAFIQNWNRHGELKGEADRYATSEDLISSILDYTPESKREEVIRLLK